MIVVRMYISVHRIRLRLLRTAQRVRDILHRHLVILHRVHVRRRERERGAFFSCERACLMKGYSPSSPTYSTDVRSPKYSPSSKYSRESPSYSPSSPSYSECRYMFTLIFHCVCALFQLRQVRRTVSFRINLCV